MFVEKSEKAAEPEWVADFPGGSDGKESVGNAGDLVQSLGWEDPRRRERLPSPVFWPRGRHETVYTKKVP